MVFAKLAGSNVYDLATGKYPWVEFQEDIAEYFDTPDTTVGLPMKPVAASRGHLKTEIGVHALTRYVLNNPEKRNCIIGASHDRSKKNLAHINGMLQTDKMQALFPDILYPTGADQFTKEDLLVRRSGDYREKTIETLGRNANLAGRHYNGIIWIDDIVSEQDDIEGNPQISENILMLLTHIVEAVADPGCEIWLTYTRYHPADPYGRIMESDDYDSMIVRSKSGAKGVLLDCFLPGSDGKEAIYPFRHCVAVEEEVEDVVWRGTTYPTVRRKSLTAIEKRVKPAWWYSQMLNRPMVGGAVGFAPEQFDHVLPCMGVDFESWLMAGDNGRMHGLGDHSKGTLITHILGDPSYRGGRSNDYALLWVVAQTKNNHFIVLDAFRQRMGYQGDREYARKALRFKEQYSANQLAIEKHAKESIETVFQLIAAEEGKTVAFFNLKDNSHKSKKDRIATLIPIVSEGRLHFCQNVNSERMALRNEAGLFPACCDGGHNMHDDCLDAMANMTQVFTARKINGRNADANKWRNSLPKGVKRFLGRGNDRNRSRQRRA